MPEFPNQLSYLWAWFCELSYTDFSPLQMLAFFELEGIQPKRWEIDLIQRLRQEIKNI